MTDISMALTEMNEALFLDTVAILALVNKSDELHPQAIRTNQDLLKAGTNFITTDYILIEVANSLCKARYRHLAVQCIENIRRSARCTVLHVNPELLEKGWQLYQERPDKDWGLTDCISFVVMWESKLTKAFTSDHHFEQAGFLCLLSIE